MANMNNRSSEVTEYIEQFPPEMRERLATIREFVFSVVPDAQEMIRSKIPSYTLHKKVLIYFAAQNGYVGFYADAQIIETLVDELAAYGKSKAGVHLPLDQPIPYDLLRKMILMKAADNDQKSSRRK